ncbi:hypothetical protein PICMEDRAFT_15899 [Pichia membranifaciens NRRL Y-2026]|uniref:Uncharacterized protein n=1 Tax=Pichia membranifaciens NRRL Y-2026 TaxID=763406 RepID=A0A1E3NR67_9ASCO|nr:hypothetical protein PICMEDRAFT_15899 [Pichia membranifaciens NRRL Y-2026]ODQ48053.1 hypothetical protein PICMEDRAFT_15899 [Pichia membranifaciens NRRL Y-2026]
MLRPTLPLQMVKVGSSGDTVLENMKSKLLHLRNEHHVTKTKETKFEPSRVRYNSEIRNHPHPKDTVTGIYQQPKILKSAHPNNNKVPKSMLRRRDELNKKLSSEQEYQGIHWTPEFATSNLSKTSLQAKSEFDNLIKDWISTNWLNVNPIIQQRPCHILIHDKLLYENISLCETIYKLIIARVPEIAENAPYETVKVAWNNEMDRLLQGRQENLSKLQIERGLREIVKNIYLQFVKDSKTATQKVNSFVKDSFMVRKIISSLYINVKYDEKIFGKLRNIENLNERNDITIIKDNELGFIPSLDYMNLLKKINNKKDNPLQHLNVLKYKSVFGNKINDFQNLQTLKHMLVTKKLHCNEKFIILTGERAISLEYFRLLKLFNKTYANLKLKGCVIYLNRSQALKNKDIIDKKKYTGREMYYVVEEFTDIYDIIEVL